MRTRTREAIKSEVGVKMNALRTRAIRYHAEKNQGTNAGLALHQTYHYLTSEEIPKLIDDMVAYCVGVKVRDAQEIVEVLEPMKEQLSSYGHSLGAGYRGVSVGQVTNQVANFAASVDGLVRQVLPKARAAIEAARAKDPSLGARLKDAWWFVIVGLALGVAGVAVGIWKAKTGH